LQPLFPLLPEGAQLLHFAQPLRSQRIPFDARKALEWGAGDHRGCLTQPFGSETITPPLDEARTQLQVETGRTAHLAKIAALGQNVRTDLGAGSHMGRGEFRKWHLPTQYLLPKAMPLPYRRVARQAQ
jgi:hypothetical protein